MGDYMYNLEQVINRLERKPIVILFSMGELITHTLVANRNLIFNISGSYNLLW
jgi:hypothetical protein